MRKRWVIVGAVMVLSACSAAEVTADRDDDIATEHRVSKIVSATSPGTAKAKPESGTVTFADNEKKGTAEREFTYSWPSEVAEIPELAAELKERRAADLAGQKNGWTDQIDNCPPESESCSMSAFELEWQVVADTPRFLSLSNSFYIYAGGAHGMHGRGSLIWDKQERRSLDPYDVFTSLEAVENAMGDRACTLLNREREKRRGMPVEPGNWPDQCVAMGDETVLFFGSSGKGKIDRIGIYYAPYIAGPYAEGDFEFTLPVTEAMMQAVKPQYRGAFARAQ